MSDKKKPLSFPVMFQKVDVVEDNNTDCRFTKVKVWLMHLGENFNNTVFEKSVVDDAIPTLGYIPIVGFLEKNILNEDDFSGHKYIKTKTENGIEKKYVGTAYGVITSYEDNNAHYEERLCDDGITRTFLVVDGLLWNIFEDGVDIMNRDLIKGQSMELYDKGDDSIDGYEDENGIFHFTKFAFRAACILGKTVEPAMINSTIEVQFTMSDFVKDIQSELHDKFTTFTRLMDEKNNQGGNNTMAETNYTQTLLSQFEDISNIVSNHEVTLNRYGESVSRFYLKDIQDNEAIVVDRNDNYNIYGYQLTINGDKPVIDFSNGCRKKVRYENYEEGEIINEPSFNFGKHIDEIETAAFEKLTEANDKLNKIGKEKQEIEANYTSIKEEYDDIKPKYDEFVKAEAARLDAEIEAKKDAEFSKYEFALADDEDFANLKNKKEELSIKEIESECAILFARKSIAQANYSKSKNKPLTSGVIEDDFDDEENYVSTKYGYIPIGR